MSQLNRLLQPPKSGSDRKPVRADGEGSVAEGSGRGREVQEGGVGDGEGGGEVEDLVGDYIKDGVCSREEVRVGEGEREREREGE